ncbi:hypothetical protein C8J57DRAFT_1521928 [Mycena rebaudengoi]|nr:hypothetical protein C8J57DRAFT_1521928 [Mycena rebaudengoi]
MQFTFVYLLAAALLTAVVSAAPVNIGPLDIDARSPESQPLTANMVVREADAVAREPQPEPGCRMYQCMWCAFYSTI